MASETTTDEGLDPGSLDELGVDECWRLLGTQPVGRVAVIVGHYPLVFPVNFAVADKSIVYRTGSGTKLHAIHRSNVTFEVDEIDLVHLSGWSVMVKGVAQELNIDRNRHQISEAELGDPSGRAPAGYRLARLPVTTASLLAVAEDDHRTIGVSDAVLADRSKQHPGELAMAAAADYEQVRAAGGLHERGGRMSLYHADPYLQIRVDLPDVGRCLGDQLLGVGCRVVVGGERQRPSVTGRPLPGHDHLER
jgi:nitroimidazol reductase NimA-like FMN-containing flavoprotein (pyridoxamine 5'-phosphate oxidase superfamily)